MSRIGKKPVPVPANVQASVEGQTVKVKGPKGELSLKLVEEVKASKTAEGIEKLPGWRRSNIAEGFKVEPLA